MVQLLDRLIWVFCIVFVVLGLAIDQSLLLISLFAAIIIRFVLFPVGKITKAVAELHSNSTLIPESITKRDASREEKPQMRSSEFENYPPKADQHIAECATENLDSNQAFDTKNEEEVQPSSTYQANENKQVVVEDLDNQYQDLGRKLRETPRKPNMIQNFFAENLLAKVGGILLFLGVLFFLRLIYSEIGPIGKIVFGFIIGFAAYGIGIVLDKKQLLNESRVLLGVGVLINYLVILSGRFLIGGDLSGSTVLPEGVTFLLLTLNTLLAVVTGLTYESETLLIYSFVFAYLNPFLMGSSKTTTPYTLAGYATMVSIGAMLLTLFAREGLRKSTQTILRISFLGGNLLVLVAPFETIESWYFKLTIAAILNLATIVVAYRCNQKEDLSGYFFGAYLSLFLLLCFGSISSSSSFVNTISSLSYLSYLAIMAIAGITLFVFSEIKVIFNLSLLPLVFLVGLLNFGFIPISLNGLFLGSTMLFYLAILGFLGSRISSTKQWHTFISLGGLAIFFAVFPNIHRTLPWLSGSTAVLPNEAASYGVAISALIFLIAAYLFSFRQKLESLYPLGSILSVFILLPVIQREGSFLTFSVTCIIIYALLNLIVSFYNKQLWAVGYKDLGIGLVCGVLFCVFEIYYFGSKYFSGISIGLAYLGQAILYFAIGLQKMPSINAQFKSKESLGGTDTRNFVYVMLGVSLSLFSLAIAFVFSAYPQIVSTVWLLEASLMFFLYKQSSNGGIYLAGIVLMFIGLAKLAMVVDLIGSGDLAMLIPLSVVFASFVLNLKWLNSSFIRTLQDVGHVVGIIMIGVSIFQMFESPDQGQVILSLSVYSVILSYVYSYFNVGWIKNLFLIFLALFSSYQIGDQASFNYHGLQGLWYLSTIVLGFGTLLFYDGLSKNKLVEESADSPSSGVIAVSMFFIYAYLISSFYVYNFFANSFVVTIYWGILAFSILSYGIANNIIRYRTAGLYILIFTVTKILVSDIWLELYNAGTRIFALMIVGVLMIFISSLYTKKYGGNLKGEMNLKNLV